MTASVLTSQHPFMNQGAYGSPAAPLFTAMPPYMADYYSGAGLGAADPYAAAAAAGSLFGTPPQQAATAGPSGPAAAGYLYQSPSSQSAGGGLSGGGGVPGDDIRTVFISGLPHDVKERELHNLLRFMPGYEASQMNWKTGGPQGFALFSSAAHARAMVDILSGLSFDDGVLLRAEMAHKNMVRWRRRREGAGIVHVFDSECMGWQQAVACKRSDQRVGVKCWGSLCQQQQQQR